MTPKLFLLNIVLLCIDSCLLCVVFIVLYISNILSFAYGHWVLLRSWIGQAQ